MQPEAPSRARVEPERAPSARASRRSEHSRRNEDLLDPATRQSAHLAPPLPVPTTPAAGQTAPEVKARTSLEELLPNLVKRIAWAGDARRGSVRMELGAGPLAGGTVLVHADEGKVRVEVTTPPGADADEWRRRIDARLRASGIDVVQIDVA